MDTESPGVVESPAAELQRLAAELLAARSAARETPGFARGCVLRMRSAATELAREMQSAGLAAKLRAVPPSVYTGPAAFDLGGWQLEIPGAGSLTLGATCFSDRETGLLSIGRRADPVPRRGTLPAAYRFEQPEKLPPLWAFVRGSAHLLLMGERSFEGGPPGPTGEGALSPETARAVLLLLLRAGLGLEIPTD